MTNQTNRGLGWRPDLPDVRDEKFAFKAALRHELRSELAIPIRKLVPWRYTSTKTKDVLTLPIRDQLDSNSCTGNSTATMVDITSGWVPRSALEPYWFGRVEIGETDRDEGAYIRDVIKHTAIEGIGSETLWPFDVSKITTKPSSLELLSASRHKVKTYHRLQTRTDFLSCLTEGFPFVIGFACYDDFVTNDSYVDLYGILTLPSGSMQGGHAVCVIGFDNDFRNTEWGKRGIAAGIDVPSSVYIVRNSWGPNWGYKGNFAVDARYFENSNLADDAWTVRFR
jgi:hypothetical protein